MRSFVNYMHNIGSIIFNIIDFRCFSCKTYDITISLLIEHSIAFNAKIRNFNLQKCFSILNMKFFYREDIQKDTYCQNSTFLCVKDEITKTDCWNLVSIFASAIHDTIVSLWLSNLPTQHKAMVWNFKADEFHSRLSTTKSESAHSSWPLLTWRPPLEFARIIPWHDRSSSVLFRI